MARFTKSNNPNKKRRAARKKDYTEKCIAAGKEMLIDRQNGYTVPLEYYENKTKN